MREKTLKCLQNILDTFTGQDDDGMKYMYLRQALEEFDEKSIAGDKKADLILDVVHRFSKLIDISTRPHGKFPTRESSE